MFFTALTDFSSYPSFETHTGRHSAVGVYVSLWSCCLCMSPEVWFSPQSLCNHFVFREESEYKLLLFWLYTYFSAGKYHGRWWRFRRYIQKLLMVLTVFVAPLFTVSAEHWSRHRYMRSEESCCNGSRFYSLLSSPHFPESVLLSKKPVEAVRQA